MNTNFDDSTDTAALNKGQRVIMTNKQNGEMKLVGKVEIAPGVASRYIDVLIDGTITHNRFAKGDWDIQEEPVKIAEGLYGAKSSPWAVYAVRDGRIKLAYDTSSLDARVDKSTLSLEQFAVEIERGELFPLVKVES